MIRLLLTAFGILLTLTLSLAQDNHRELRRGDRLFDRQEFTEAEKHYRKAISENPNDAQAYYNNGNALYRQGRYPEAAEPFQQAANKAKSPDLRADALHNLGNVYLQQKKWKEAVEAYEKSLRNRPNDPATQMNLQFAKKKLKAQQQQQNPQPQPQQQQQQQQQQQEQQARQQPTPRQQQQMNRRLTKEEAERMLKTSIEQEDRRNAQKYREGQQPPPRTTERDW